MKKRVEASSAFSLFFNFFKCVSDFSIEIVRFRWVKEKAWVGNNSSRSISSMSRRYVRDCISCTSSVAVGNKTKSQKPNRNKEKEEKQKWLKPHTSRKNNNQELCLRQNSIVTLRKSRLLLLFFFLFHLENTKQNFHSIIPKIQKEIEREMGFAHPILFHL